MSQTIYEWMKKYEIIKLQPGINRSIIVYSGSRCFVRILDDNRVELIPLHHENIGAGTGKNLVIDVNEV